MKPSRILLVIALLVLAGCGTASAAASHARPAPTVTRTVTPSAPAPVSTTATISGSCVTGGETWVDSLDSYSGFETSGWDFPVQVDPQDPPAYPVAGYQITLTDTSQVTAQVTGFSVVFYASSGTELGSDSEDTQPELIVPGQALTWTEMSNTSVIGGSGLPVGYGAPGSDSNIPANAASCQLGAWTSGQ